jgi:MurNAc alpha-1-phosphate uridylyltransferase
MNAMILAAGRGERMRPLTDTCPKPLLTVDGKPLIVYHLEALKIAGIENVVINVSWLAEKVMEYLGDGSQFGLRISYSHEAVALETAGGIIQALNHLDDEFIVVNADIYTDFDFSTLPPLTAAAHLVLVDNPEYNQSGDFSIEQGLLVNRGARQFTFSGIACYRKSFFKGLPEGQMALAPLLRAGADNKSIHAELYNGFWSDVGTVTRLSALQS